MSTLGLQATGLVEAVGLEAGGFAPGDRVAYRATTENKGLHPVLSERDLIGFPKDVSLDTAAALLPLGLLSRTIVKLQKPIGRGNRVYVTPDSSGADSFVRAWVVDLNGIVVDAVAEADVVIASSDYEAARRWRFGAGVSQQAATDVFQAVRRGVFAGLSITSFPMIDADKAKSHFAAGTGPVVLLPEAA
jgi:NADPH2:quinone reductase